MEKSGVKTRPLEQTVLPVEADLLLGPDSSSEMDLETDDQSYSPTKVYALTWHGYMLGNVAEIQNFPTCHQDLSMEKPATRGRRVHLHTLVDR